jgi:ankyrin repeat protein
MHVFTNSVALIEPDPWISRPRNPYDIALQPLFDVYNAIDDHKPNLIVELIRKNPGVLYQCDHRFYTPLHHAVARRCIECVEYIVRLGDKKLFLQRDRYGNTALHLAVMCGDDACKILEALFSNEIMDSAVVSQNIFSSSPLDCALIWRNMAAMKFLLNRPGSNMVKSLMLKNRQGSIPFESLLKLCYSAGDNDDYPITTQDVEVLLGAYIDHSQQHNCCWLYRNFRDKMKKYGINVPAIRICDCRECRFWINVA